MPEGLVEAFVEEISTLEGPARMTDFFNAFYKKHNTDKAGLREALEAPTSGTWANALGSRYSDLITITPHHFRPVRAGQAQHRDNDEHPDPPLRLPEELANHVKRWKGTVAAFISSGSRMKKRQNRRAIATAAAGTPCPTCGRNLRASGKRRGTYSTVEHIVPLNLGGDNTYTGAFPQCVAMCFDCNAVRNTLVAVEKASRTGTSPNRFDDLVEFLILQVYDPASIGDSPLWKAFEREFTLRTKRSPEPVSHRNAASKRSRSKKDARTWIVVPGPSTNPATLVHEISLERIESHADRIVIVRQEDASRTDLHSWIGLDFQPMIAPFGASDLHLSVAKLSYQRKGLVDLWIHASLTSDALDSLIVMMGGHVTEFAGLADHDGPRSGIGFIGRLLGLFRPRKKGHSPRPEHKEQHSSDSGDASPETKGQRRDSPSLTGMVEVQDAPDKDVPTPQDEAHPPEKVEDVHQVVPSKHGHPQAIAPKTTEASGEIRIPLLNSMLEGKNFLLPLSPTHAADILRSMNGLLPSVVSMAALNKNVLAEVQAQHPGLAKSRINRSLSKFMSSMKVKGHANELPCKALKEEELVDVVATLNLHWQNRFEELNPLTPEHTNAATLYFAHMERRLNQSWTTISAESIALLPEQGSTSGFADIRAVMETVLSEGPMSMAAFIGHLAKWQKAQGWSDVGAKGLAVHHGLPPKTPVNETLALNYSDLVSIEGPQGSWVVSLVRGIGVTSMMAGEDQSE